MEINYSSSIMPKRDGTQRTKTELERTVVTLKNLIDKLQLENRKLRISTTPSVNDLDLQCNCLCLREEHEQALKRIMSLETELDSAERKILMMSEKTNEVDVLKQQLNRKAELLSKVKDLLQKAALNEKALRQKVSILLSFQDLCNADYFKVYFMNTFIVFVADTAARI